MDVLVEFPFAQTGSSRVRDSGASFCSNGAIERDYSSDTRARIVEFVNNITCGSSMWESDGQAEENSLQRVKFLCSFGGSILPRPSDGKLRYVGGETRIVCVNRDISYSELMFKMTEFYDQALTLKYQLPEEDLDALVSVLCDDDLANMMEEYDKLEATDGFTRLRVFLFSAAEYDLSPVCEESETDQRYVDALNGVPEAGDARKTSEISLYGPAESFNCAAADNGSVQRVQASGIRQHVVISLPISPRNPLIHQVASPPSSPLNHHPPPPASPLGHHRQPAIQLGEPEEYYQEQPWDLSSRMHRQDLMCLASTGLPVMPPEEPYRDSVTAAEFTYRAQSEVIHPEINHGVALSQKQRESVEAYTSNDKYRGNLQQVDRHEDVPPLIGVSDRCCEDKPVHDTLSLRVHIHGRNLPQQPYMHPVYQAARHYPGEVLQDQEFGPQRKFPFHPMECSGVYEDSGLPMSHDFGSSSQTIAASDFCLGSAAPASRLKFSDEHEVYSENQAHMQVVWAPNCGMREANYEQRSEHSNNQWSGPGAPSSAHPNYNHHLVTEKQGRWHHQLPYTEDELRLRGQNINHLQNMFEGNFASKCQCTSIKLRENLSKARGLKIYPEHMPPYPDHHGSSRLETQILDPGSEYHPMMVKELSLQNANAQVNQLGYPTDQMHSCAGYQERVDGVVGWALHHGEESKVSSAERAPGFLAVEEGMNKDVGRSDYLDHSPRGYYKLQPEEACCLSLHSEFYMDAATSQFELCPRVPAPVNLGTGHRNYDAMISRGNLQQELRASGSADSPHNNIQHRGTGTYFNQASGFHLEPTDRENPWSYSLAGKRNSEANLVQKGGKNLEGLQFPYTCYEVDAAHEPNVPAYMLGDHLQNRIENAFEYEGNLPKEFIPDMDPKLIRDIKDINTSFVSPHFQMHLQRQTHAECPADGFVTLGSNDILSSSACSRAITSSRVLLPDSLTFSLSTEVLPSLLSSVPTSTVLASPILPIYDQSPASSVNVTAPEDLWSDNGKQKQFNECKESVAKASETVQLTDVLISDKRDVRQDLDLDKRLVENCVNDTPEVSICSTFANMDSPVRCCSPSCSSIAPTPKIEGKQTSTRSVKETVYEEVKEEAKLHRSNEEENLLDKKAPQGHSLGLGEESHCDSMNMAKNDLSASETQKLAEELQTIRNDDIEEIRELGSGTYGTVYYGKWKGSDVAIKRIKASCFSGSQSERERMIADFWREARTLGQLHHPNVVAFYGIVRDGPGGTLATVTEYMVNGSLKQVLRRKDRTIDRRKRLIIAMDVAFGMEYLHGKNIVHFDLKSDNLLVNMRDPQRPVCKIGDLGLSKVKQRTLVSGGVRGTLPWMAPELLSGKSGMVTDKIDVYSFGIVMWELLTGEEPYAKMHCGEIIGGIMSNTLRPSIPSWCDPAWRSLMEKCWSFDPGQRPPFPDIAKELRAMAASINLK